MTQRSGARILRGHTWGIKYEDYSGANGQVYLDRVSIGPLTVPKQAVGVATSVSKSFAQTQTIDGLLGMAFSTLNSIKPNQQKTWFDNIRPTLSRPLFAAALKRRTVGSYDFGYIDQNKFVGNITWTPVNPNTGFWDFNATGFQVGDTPVKSLHVRATVDTGSSLWYLPKSIADAYYAQVGGATYSKEEGGYVFPCTATLPDMSVIVGSRKVTVPGINMNYQPLGYGSGQCYGGIVKDSSMSSYVFGDVFMKGLYVVFEHQIGQSPRLGFAHQPR